MNKITLRQDLIPDSQINIPIQLNWDYLGLDMAIDEYETDIIGQVIGVGRDFEVTRFAHAPETTENTEINYEFYFYSGGSMDTSENWRINYMSEGFTTKEIFYYSNNFSNSFFKLDFYDSTDDKKQTNYITVIIPTQQGLKMDATMNRTPVSIKKPKFILDYVGDKEGFFLYWLKSRTFLDINTFYMTAKFYDAKTGQFTKMANMSQSTIAGDKYKLNGNLYYYYKVVLDYEKQNYQVFDINQLSPTYNKRVGTTIPIKWYEYVNPI